MTNEQLAIFMDMWQQRLQEAVSAVSYDLRKRHEIAEDAVMALLLPISMVGAGLAEQRDLLWPPIPVPTLYHREQGCPDGGRT